MLRSLNFWLLLAAVVCGISFWMASGSPLPPGVEFRNRQDDDTSSWMLDSQPVPVHLRILNGTENAGLARQFGVLAAGRGFVVEAVGNAAGSWPKSILINRRLDAQVAAELAEQLGGLEVIRQWDQRLTEDAVLVLGEDFEKTRSAFGNGVSSGVQP